MSDKLKIYACNGLEDGKRLEFQSEGTNAATNTQAMNSLLIQMNLLRTEIVRIPMGEDERIAKLQQMDFYAVAFQMSRVYRGKRNELLDAGYAISMLLQDGAFKCDSPDMLAHEEYVCHVIDTVEELLKSGDVEEQQNDFADWWIENVVDRDIVGLQSDGVGATVRVNYGNLNQYIYDGGTYFIYLYMPRSKYNSLSEPIQRKIQKQQEVYEYCRKCFCFETGGIYGTEKDLQNAIRAGIVEDFGAQPEEVCDIILNGGTVRKIGDPITLTAAMIVKIVLAVISAVVSIIASVLAFAKDVVIAKYTVPNEPESGAANPKDWEGMDDKGVDVKTFAWGAVAIAGALLLLNSNKE